MGEDINAIRRISKVYHSEKLSGANEQYHTYLRDLVIPGDGGKSALELGCGNGYWSRILCEKYESLDIVDGSEDLLAGVVALCGSSSSKVKIHADLIEDFLESSIQKWQHIFMTFILEHLEDPVKTLDSARKRLEDGGKIFIAVPNADSIHRVIAVRAKLINSTESLSDNDVLVGHRRVYTRSLLIDHLTAASLKVVEERKVGFKPLTIQQLSSFPKEIIDTFCSSGDLVPNNSAYIAVSAVPT